MVGGRWRTLAALAIAALVPAPSDAALNEAGPNVVIYAEQWAVWRVNGGFFPSDLDKNILARDMPYKSLSILYSFFSPYYNAAHFDKGCSLRTGDPDADALTLDSNDVKYEYGNPYGNPASPRAWLGALQNFKKRYPHVNFLPSIGGWSYSHAFSDCIRDNVGKEALRMSIKQVIGFFSFDGIDIDWEYPSCNDKCGCQKEEECPETSKLSHTCVFPSLFATSSPFCALLLKRAPWHRVCFASTGNKGQEGDWAIYVNWLGVLRTQLGEFATKMGKNELLLTMAIGMNYNLLAGGSDTYKEATPIAELCSVMDHINLMTYDFFGPWGGGDAGDATVTGSHCPLKNNPTTHFDDVLNIDNSVTYILSKCKQKHKLNLGLAAYGKMWGGNSENPGHWKGLKTLTQAKNDNGQASTLTYREYRDKVVPAIGKTCEQTWDGEAASMAVYCSTWHNGGSGVFVTVETDESWKAKMEYAKNKGLGGAIIWAVADMGNATYSQYSGDLLGGLFEGWFGEKQKIGPAGPSNAANLVPYPWPALSSYLPTNPALCPLMFHKKIEPVTTLVESKCSLKDETVGEGTEPPPEVGEDPIYVPGPEEDVGQGGAAAPNIAGLAFAFFALAVTFLF